MSGQGGPADAVGDGVAAAGAAGRKKGSKSPKSSRKNAPLGLSDVSYDVSRLMKLPYRIVAVSAQCPGHEAANVLDASSAAYWSTGSGETHRLEVELGSPSLVGFLRLFNKSVSALEVSIATDRGDWVSVYSSSGGGVPHNKIAVCRTGFLPCRHVRLTFLRGRPVSLYSLEVLGVPLELVRQTYGAELEEVLMKHPLRTYFGPVKPPGATVPEAQWRKFPLHYSYARGTRATSEAKHRPGAASVEAASAHKSPSSQALARASTAPGLEKLRAPCIVEL